MLYNSLLRALTFIAALAFSAPSYAAIISGGGGGGGGTTLPADTIFTSESAPMNVCGLNALTDDCIRLYVSSAGKLVIVGVKDGVEGDVDITVKIDNGNSWIVTDNLDNVITKITPSASGRLKYEFGPNYRLKKSIFLVADSFYMHGCTLFTESALIPTGLVEPYITCGDNDANGFHRSMPINNAWAADSFTVTQYAVNTNATPANVYEIDYSAECEANSEVVGTSISATGEQPATINFENTGTCGTACAQSDLTIVTTAAIAPNGTCAGGNWFRFQGNLDATATTTAQVADVKIMAVRIDLNITTWGE